MTLISDLVPAVVRLCGNRTDVAAIAPEHMGQVITELSDNYPFEELRVTGPVVQFVPGQAAYLPDFFQVPPTLANPFTLNKVLSWFFYFQQPQSFIGQSLGTAANPGYPIQFKDISDLEVLVNILTLPQFWSQLGAYLYLAAVPQTAYYTYMRYQWKHPFTAPIAIDVDPIYLPSTWFDIINVATAERIALDLRMQDVADRMHVRLFGDPKKPGDIGMVRMKTSQTQKNQSRTSRGVQLQMGRY